MSIREVSSPNSDEESHAFTQSLVRFQVNAELYGMFGDESIKAHEFLPTYKLSTYLYSIMAGPYSVFYPK